MGATRPEVSLAVGVPMARPGEPGTIVVMTDPDPRVAFAAMTAALIADFRANGGQVTRDPFAGRRRSVSIGRSVRAPLTS